MSDDYDDYLNADESDFDTDDAKSFGDGIEEEKEKPKKKKATRARRPKAARPKKTTRKKKPVAEESDDTTVEEDEIEEEVKEEPKEEVEEVAAEEVVEEEVVEEEPKLPTDHVVHLYMIGKFSRTIERPFTAEDAEAFASNFNKTSKSYGHFATAGKESAKPAKTVPWRAGISAS